MLSRELIARYMLERARLAVFLPLAAVMAVLGRWTGDASAIDFVAATLAALAFMLAFRIWDDLEDRPRDAIEHPSRVTVVAGATAPLVALAIALALVGLSLVAMGPRVLERLAAVGAAAALLGVWYSLRGRAEGAGPSAVTNGHVVLLKYPLIAYAATPAAPSAAALATLYLALSVYEIVDDPTLRASRLARQIAITECGIASLIIVTATLAGGRIT